jgi:peptidoglycan/LPS O-acetylase OafA/YrhL
MKPEINIFKGVAMVAVIILHLIPILYNFWSPYSPFSPQAYFLIILDQLNRFCVPLFILLSGYLLTAYHIIRTPSPIEFYKRRLLKLLPLYFLWWLIIKFTWPDVGYHLYFVPLIFQLYLLFPVLYFLTKKLPVIFTLLVLIFQLFYLQFLSTTNWPDQKLYQYFFSWIFYFVLGIVLSLHEEKFKKWRVIFPLTTLTALILMLWTAFGMINRGNNVLNITFFTRLPIFFFATSFCLTAITFQEKLSLLPKKLFSFLDFFGRESYLVYLCHTILLRIIFEPFINKNWNPVFVGGVFVIWLTGVFLSVKIPVILESCKRLKQ